MQPIKFFYFFALSFFVFSYSFATESINIYPTHWWVGMKNNRLQLMVHSDQDLPQSVKVNGNGLRIQKVSQPENKHYVFIDLIILPNAQPGKFKFSFSNCDEKFLNTINAALLNEFPSLTVFGETWTNTVAASAYFTQNNINAPFKHQIKGVTDFPLNSAIYDGLNQPFGWTEGINKVYMTLSQDLLYKDPMTNCIFLDNHDMNRFYSMVGQDLAKYKMGLGMLLTMRGIPQVYYGTEILMKNYKDPNDAAVRKDFPGGWSADPTNKFNRSSLNSNENEAFAYFQQLANFRKNSPAIKQGALKQYIPQNGVYVYFRLHEKQKLMCIVNTSSDEVSIAMERFKEILSDSKQIVNALTGNIITKPAGLDIPSKSFQIFELKN